MEVMVDRKVDIILQDIMKIEDDLEVEIIHAIHQVMILEIEMLVEITISIIRLKIDLIDISQIDIMEVIESMIEIEDMSNQIIIEKDLITMMNIIKEIIEINETSNMNHEREDTMIEEIMNIIKTVDLKNLIVLEEMIDITAIMKILTNRDIINLINKENVVFLNQFQILIQSQEVQKENIIITKQPMITPNTISNKPKTDKNEMKNHINVMVIIALKKNQNYLLEKDIAIKIPMIQVKNNKIKDKSVIMSPINHQLLIKM